MAGVSLMDYQPHASTGNTVRSIEQLKHRAPITLYTPGGEPLSQSKHTVLRLQRVLDGPVARRPTVGSRVLLAVEGHPFKHVYGLGDLGLRHNVLSQGYHAARCTPHLWVARVPRQAAVSRAIITASATGM